MSTLVLVVSAAYYLISVAYLVFTYNRYKICPEFIWAVLQLIMFYGIGQKANYQNASDVKLICLYLVALICFIITSGLTNRMHAPQKYLTKIPSPENYQIRSFYMWAVLGASVLICGLYFVRGGGNVFLESLRAMLTGEDYSTKYGRMGLLHVAGTGYVYQLRIAIIPCLTLYYIFLKKNRAVSIVLAILAIIFMLGSGQRGGFISFMCIALVAVYYWQSGGNEQETEKKRRSTARTYIVILAVALSLFALTTIMNGRVSSGGSVSQAIIKRIFSDNQSTAIQAFRYVDAQPCQYGRDWYLMLRKLLPGAPSYMSLATRVFALMKGGSTDGTAPPCIWTSSYYNFGVPGVILVSSVLGVATAKLHRSYTERTCDELTTILYAGKSFLLGYWLVDGPVTLVNNGFVALCLLDFLMNWIAFKVRFKVKR
ncbi:MAG: oligosaccharide repeat unit polymerase [Clostridia bacterium]|nr:oligosaccharide repeat unit polymerase [Clostridia bacterium]